MTDNAAAGLENHRIKSFKNKGRDVEVGGSRGGPRPGLLLLPLIALLPLPAAPEEEEEEEGRGRGGRWRKAGGLCSLRHEGGGPRGLARSTMGPPPGGGRPRAPLRAAAPPRSRRWRLPGPKTPG